MREISCPALPGSFQARTLHRDWRKEMGTLDTSLMVVPFLVILAMGMFGLDERAARPRHPAKTRRFFCEVDGKGRAFLSDPDGQPWQKGAVSQIEARLVQTGSNRRLESFRRRPRI
jgi:hypothetical protein